MESHFLFLVLGALVGLVVNARFGWNPWAIIGSTSLLVLLIPLIPIAMQSDPAVARAMADSYISRVVGAMPSLLLGELAGNVAGAIFKPFEKWF